ncbi:hypothetical protein HAX54_021481, partial [Datura stramonium]|nr:hypothetical protein [Datura stramonium]
AIAKGRRQGLRSMSNSQGMQTTFKSHLVLEKGHIPSFSSTDELMQYNQINSANAQKKVLELRSSCSFEEYENEDRSFHQDAEYASQRMSRPFKSIKLDSTMSVAQRFRTVNKHPLVHKKEHMQNDVPISPSRQ